MTVSADEDAVLELPGVDRILVLAPHTDDMELGCGGTIARALGSGIDVSVVVFSRCERSLPRRMRPDRLEKECARSARELGLTEDSVEILQLPVREFPSRRQEILERLVAVRNEYDPDLILVPSGADVHQDHEVVHDEGVRAFKDRSILGYEFLWNQFTSAPGLFVRLNQECVDRKWRALTCYESQRELGRDYFDRELIESMLRVRGGQIGAEFAEGFDVIRWVI